MRERLRFIADFRAFFLLIRDLQCVVLIFLTRGKGESMSQGLSWPLGLFKTRRGLGVLNQRRRAAKEAEDETLQ